MKISIITVCFNAAQTIEDTIKSVASQKGVDVEHIVVDGASTDGTVSLVEKHSSVAKFISEPDGGIYDAMNKGIGLATGDVIGLLNADDFYHGENVLNHILAQFDDSVDACYGDLVFVKQHDVDEIVRFWKSNNYKVGLFKSGWMPAHPTFFVRKSCYEKFGVFNLHYKIAADFELLFRFIEQHRIKTLYIPKVIVKMRLGGKSNGGFFSVLNQNREIIDALKSYYPKLSIVRFITSKFFIRIKQFIFKQVH